MWACVCRRNEKRRFYLFFFSLAERYDESWPCIGAYRHHSLSCSRSFSLSHLQRENHSPNIWKIRLHYNRSSRSILGIHHPFRFSAVSLGAHTHIARLRTRAFVYTNRRSTRSQCAQRIFLKNQFISNHRSRKTSKIGSFSHRDPIVYVCFTV